MEPGDDVPVSTRDMIAASFVALIWGVNFVVIDLGMDGVPPLLFVAIRFTLVLLVGLLLVRRPDVPWPTLLGVGALVSLGQFGFLYAAIAAGMPAGLAALVLQAQVVLTIVVAAGVLRDVPTPVQLAGVLLGTAGLVVVALGRGATTPLPALLLCLAAALSWACGNVLLRASGARGGLALTVWSSVVVPVPALLASLVLDGPAAIGAALAGLGATAVLSTLYTVVLATLVGYALFTRLVSSYPAATVLPWILLVPPIAMLTAWLVLAEVPATAEVVGGSVMLAGVLVAVLGSRRRAPAPAPPGPAPVPTPTA